MPTCTITKSGRSDEYGRPLLVGSTYTGTLDQCRALFQAGFATVVSSDLDDGSTGGLAQPFITAPLLTPTQALTAVGGGGNRGSAPLAGRPTAVLMGDSKTAFNGGTSISTPVQSISASYDSKGIVTQLMVRTGHPFSIIGNAGIGGQKTREMLARFQTDVLVYNPDWLVLLAGTNDVDTSDLTVANIVQMWDTAGNAGIRVLAFTIPPLGTTAANYAVKNPYHQTVNFSLRSYANTRPWVLLVDIDQATLDPATAFQPLAGMLSDGVHEYALGAATEAAYAASALAKLNLQRSPWLGSSSGDATNLLSNPLLSGTGSSTPTGWAKVGTSTISYLPRQNAPAWCQYAVANGGGAAGLTSNASIGANLAIGDKVIACVEFETDTLDPAAAANSQGARLVLQAYNGASFFASVSDIYWDTGAGYGNYLLPPSGVLETPPFVVPAGTTIIQIYVVTNGGGNYRFSRAAIRNLTKLGLSA